MNQAQLLLHFDRISEAPDAVPRLRRFILDLAVRGKLGTQDPNDEPASELLKRIHAEKARLVRQGEKKRKGLLPETSKQEHLFELPHGWSWVRFGDIYSLEYGDNLPAEKRSNTGEYPVYGSNGIVGSHSECFVKAQCIVVGRKGSAGALNLSMSEGCCVTDVAYYCIPPHEVDLAFSFKLFHTLGLDMLGKGIKPGLNRNEVYVLILGLPPLAEQRRIVAKVDELMAVCDRLESAQVERENRRDRLVAASLDRLNNGDDVQSFHEHTRFHLNLLPRLTTRPPHVQQLRQTILNLAVRGLLVPQDPNDEPASELLKRVQAEKVRLIKEGKIKKERSLEAIQGNTAPFELPKNWEWIRLGELTELITKGSSPKWQGVEYVSEENGILFVTSENVGNYRLRKMEELKYVEKRFNEIEPRSILRFGDILMNLVGASIGRTAIYDLHDEANINQAVALIRLVHIKPGLSADFLLHYFNSPCAVQLMLASRVVTAQPNMSLTDAREFPVPIPPLAEQHRIVSKVDELMVLFDRLEAQLTKAQTESRHLLESLLYHALTG